MDLPVSSATMQWEGTPTLRRIVERLHNTYCRYIGVQYMHIHDLARRWLRDGWRAPVVGASATSTPDLAPWRRLRTLKSDPGEDVLARAPSLIR
jgi:hypothetical protein